MGPDLKGIFVMELCSKDLGQLLLKQLRRFRRFDYFLIWLGWRHHWLTVMKLRRDRCLAIENVFMGDLRWSSKWTKKKNQLLRGGQCVNKVSQSLFETVA